MFVDIARDLLPQKTKRLVNFTLLAATENYLESIAVNLHLEFFIQPHVCMKNSNNSFKHHNHFKKCRHSLIYNFQGQNEHI